MNTIALTITDLARDALHRGIESTLTLTTPAEKRKAEYILRHQDVVAWYTTDVNVTIYPMVRHVEQYVA